MFLLQHGARVDLGRPLEFLSSSDFALASWPWRAIAKLFIDLGATLDPNFPHGEEAVRQLINPTGRVVPSAADILKLLLQENALIPAKFGGMLNVSADK